MGVIYDRTGKVAHLLTRQQLNLAARVYCQQYNLSLDYILQVEWATIAAGLAIII